MTAGSPPEAWPSGPPTAWSAGPPSETWPSGAPPAFPSGPPSEWPAASPLGPAPVVPPGPGGPPPGAGRSGSVVRPLVAVAVVAVLVLVAVLALGGLLGGDGDDLDVADPGTEAPSPTFPDPGSTAPGADPAPPVLPNLPDVDPTVDPEALARPLDEVVPEIVAFVEAERGHRFPAPPSVEGVSDAEFEARLLAAQGGEAALDVETEAWLRTLGLLPPGVDAEEAWTSLLASAVQGFYDPETDDLVVRGAVVTPYVQTVIAHELTHALDDQIFDLSRLDSLAERPDESAFAFQALVEGSARVVEQAFESEALDAEEQAAVEVEKLDPLLQPPDDPGPGGPDPADLFLLGLVLAIPYGSGEHFVDDLLDGGLPALDAAFRAPPTTSEQVLDVAVYASGEPAIDVEDPEADGTEVGRGAFGAVDVRILELVADPMGVAARLDPEQLFDGVFAVEPLDGFGGGEYVTWGEDEQFCLRANLAGDDVAGAAAITEIVETWAETVGAEVTATGPTTLTFTVCPGAATSPA